MHRNGLGHVTQTATDPRKVAVWQPAPRDCPQRPAPVQANADSPAPASSIKGFVQILLQPDRQRGNLLEKLSGVGGKVAPQATVEPRQGVVLA
jgi:hypothetical protein